MKPVTSAFLILLFALGFGSIAQARLGETEATIIQRYGRPMLKQHFGWCDKENFLANGFSIEVTFLNGVSAGESYHINSGGLTDSQVEDLLNANSQGYTWYDVDQADIPKDIVNPIRQMWQRPNGSTATFTGPSLEFKSIWLIFAERDAAQQAPPTPSTAGF